MCCQRKRVVASHTRWRPDRLEQKRICAKKKKTVNRITSHQPGQRKNKTEPTTKKTDLHVCLALERVVGRGRRALGLGRGLEQPRVGGHGSLETLLLGHLHVLSFHLFSCGEHGYDNIVAAQCQVQYSACLFWLGIPRELVQALICFRMDTEVQNKTRKSCTRAALFSDVCLLYFSAIQNLNRLYEGDENDTTLPASRACPIQHTLGAAVLLAPTHTHTHKKKKGVRREKKHKPSAHSREASSRHRVVSGSR